MADRLFIDKKYETAVIDKIDAEKIIKALAICLSEQYGETASATLEKKEEN